jgi:hypothetical protein
MASHRFAHGLIDGLLSDITGFFGVLPLVSPFSECVCLTIK